MIVLTYDLKLVIASPPITLQLPINGTNINVSWGDGTSSSILTNVYNTKADYTITITGTGLYMYTFLPSTYLNTLTICSNFSDVLRMDTMFENCSELISVPNQLPTTLTIPSLQNMFYNAININDPNIISWVVDSITDMQLMFYNASKFNQNISTWNTGNVIFMIQMFFNATSFNQPISIWNTVNVKSMNEMFKNATSFNQNIGNWNFTTVTNMKNMFDDSGLSVTTYNSMLDSLSINTTFNSSLTEIGVKNLHYTNAIARKKITDAGINLNGDIFDGVFTTITLPNPIFINYRNRSTCTGSTGTVSEFYLFFKYGTDPPISIHATIPGGGPGVTGGSYYFDIDTTSHSFSQVTYDVYYNYTDDFNSNLSLGPVPFTYETFDSFSTGGNISIYDPVTFTSNGFKTDYLYYYTPPLTTPVLFDTYTISISGGIFSTPIFLNVSFDSSGNMGPWYPYDSTYIFGTNDILRIDSDNKNNFGTKTVTVTNTSSVTLDSNDTITSYTSISKITASIVLNSTTSTTFSVSLVETEYPFSVLSLPNVTFTGLTGYILYPYKKEPDISSYYNKNVKLKFTLGNIDLYSIVFQITDQYLSITYDTRSVEYFKIEKIPTTLTYDVTTTTDFTQNIDIYYGPYFVETYAVSNIVKNTPIIYDFYPYKKLTDESCLNTMLELIFTPENLTQTGVGSFTLNPYCIESSSSGTYSILSSITIEWVKIVDDSLTDYRVNTDTFNLTLDNGDVIASNVTEPFTWKVFDTSYFGTYIVTIHSNGKLIFNFITITIVNASPADYGSIQNKKLGVAPCSSVSLTPVFARATSNNICVTNKKNNVISNTTIKLDNRTFVIPCAIVKHLPELKQLLTKMTIKEALLFLIQKYNIQIPTKISQLENKKRYVYPTADAKINYPILQFNTSFRLGEYSDGSLLVKNPIFVEKPQDARILEVCNDDTKTFSTLYSDMLQNATYWIGTLPSFQESSYTYCIIRPTNGSLKKVISGSITLRGKNLVFTPVILRALLFFYEPYPPNTDITIVYTNANVSNVLTFIQQNYFQDSVVINSSCL